jgi:hypothetical protein
MNPLLREELASILADSPPVPNPPPRPMPHDLHFPPIDVSPRARMMRAILRIADRHGWHSAIIHFMETRNVSHLSDLTDPQLADLCDRMEGYVDAAETGSSLADCLPAS